MNIIHVPRAADLSLVAQAEQLRLKGFTIRSLIADRLLVDAPTSGNATIFDALGWLRGPGLLITRSEAGLTITPRPAVVRMAVASLLPGVTLATFFIHSPLRAVAVGVGVSLVAFAFSYASARRQKPTVLQFTATTDPPADQGHDEHRRI